MLTLQGIVGVLYFTLLLIALTLTLALVVRLYRLRHRQSQPDIAGAAALAMGMAFVMSILDGIHSFDRARASANSLHIGIASGIGILASIFFASTIVIVVGPTIPGMIARAVNTLRQSAHSRYWSRSVGRPPGSLLLRLADNTCRKATSDLVGQMVADMRVEHFEALKEGRKVKAQWIKYLHYVCIARALTIDRLLSAALNYVLGALRAGKP